MGIPTPTTLLLLISLSLLSLSKSQTPGLPNFFLGPEESTCTSSYVIDASNRLPPDLKTGTKTVLTVDAIFEIVSECLMNNPAIQSLLVLTGASAFSGTTINYFHLFNDPSSPFGGVTLAAEEDEFSGSQTLFNTAFASFDSLLAVYEFFGSIDQSTGQISAQVITAEGQMNQNTVPATLNYNSGVFDSSVKMYICSDPVTGEPTFACKIKSVRFWYTYIDALSPSAEPHFYGVYPNVLGEYRMIDGNPSTIGNSKGSLPPITIGSTGPTWDAAKVIIFPKLALKQNNRILVISFPILKRLKFPILPL